jgi:hypothetical protein
VTWLLIEPHHDRVKAWPDAEVSVATIAQQFARQARAASESSVRRWIATYFADETAREKVTVPRGPVQPGSEAQIDYGRLGMWLDLAGDCWAPPSAHSQRPLTHHRRHVHPPDHAERRDLGQKCGDQDRHSDDERSGGVHH